MGYRCRCSETLARCHEAQNWLCATPDRFPPWSLLPAAPPPLAGWLQLGSLDQLASLQQPAVQACCNLTAATLKVGCWNACSPPASLSAIITVRALPLAALPLRVCRFPKLCGGRGGPWWVG